LKLFNINYCYSITLLNVTKSTRNYHTDENSYYNLQAYSVENIYIYISRIDINYYTRILILLHWRQIINTPSINNDCYLRGRDTRLQTALVRLWTTGNEPARSSYHETLPTMEVTDLVQPAGYTLSAKPWPRWIQPKLNRISYLVQY